MHNVVLLTKLPFLYCGTHFGKFMNMKNIVCILLLLLSGNLIAQNLELRNGKDFEQPGKINPSLAGIQEDVVRLLTDTKVGSGFEFMLDGKLPLKLGTYMVGYERMFTEDVANSVVNVTYGRELKNKKFNWRYGATFQMNNKSLVQSGFDSTTGYQFKDLNGELQSVANVGDLKDAISYVNLELGTSVKYNNLFAGLSIENLLQQNVSLDASAARKLPVTANLVLGGFMGLGDKITLFPSAVLVSSGSEIFARASLDLSTEKVNFGAAYTTEEQRQDIKGTLAFKINKKTFLGISYAHPLSGTTGSLVNTTPEFGIFFNQTVLKDANIFKSDFAKQMKKFY